MEAKSIRIGDCAVIAAIDRRNPETSRLWIVWFEEEEAVGGNAARTGENEGNEGGTVDKGEFGSAFTKNNPTVNFENGDAHGDSERDGGEAREEPDGNEAGADDLGEDDSPEVDLGSPRENSGEVGGFLGAGEKFRPTVPDQHGKAGDQAKGEEAEVAKVTTEGF